MADNGENIGSANISIDADYSGLAQQFQQVQNDAAVAGEKVAASFTQAAVGTKAFDDAMQQLVSTGMTTNEAFSQLVAGTEAVGAGAAQSATQLTLFADAVDAIPFADANGQLNMFTDELEPLAANTNAAAQAAQGLGEAEQEVEEKTKDTTSSLTELLEKLVAVQAALKITEALKAFGEEALAASDDVKRAEISLTALTGSAEQAEKEVAALEALAVQDGLSMPNLLTAAARMQALLGAAAPVPEILRQLANSAAVSQQGIESAANAFDRMATSGNASARVLVPLGINLGDLARSFNTLTESSLATEKNIGELFKTLDQTQRVDVLTQALSKLNGIGQEVADKTFGGQWAALVAQWAIVMKSAGDALAPVILDLTQFIRLDVAPAVKAIFDAFNELPGPIKDTVVAIGLLTTATVPLIAGIGAFGIALKGFGAIAELFGIQLGKMVVAEEAAAAGAQTAAAGTVAAGTSAVAAVPLIGALVVELGILGKAWHDMTQAQDDAATAQKDVGRNLAVLATSLRQHGVDISDLTEKYKQGVISPQQYREALLKLVDGFVGANKAAYDHKAAIDLVSNSVKEISKTANEEVLAFDTAKAAFDRISAGLKTGANTAQEYQDALEKLNAAAGRLAVPVDAVGLALANNAREAQKAGQAYQTALGVFQSVFAAFERGQGSYAAVTAAQEKLTAAEQAAAAAGAAIPGTLAAIGIAAQAATENMTTLATSQQLSADKSKAQSDSLVVLGQDVVVAGQKLDLLVAAQQKAQQAADTHRGSQEQLRTVMEAVVRASADLQAKQDALALAQIRAGNAAAEAAGQEGLFGQELKEANLNLEIAKTKFESGAVSATAYMGAQKAALQAVMALGAAEADSSANVSRSTAAWAAAEVSLAQAKVKLDLLTGAYHDHLASLQDVVSAQHAELDAQIAVDQEQAAAATGTQGLTDKVSLYTQILAAAKAKQEDLSVAVAEGRARAQDLLAAEQAVTSATRNLADAQRDCKPPTDALTESVDAQVKAWGALGAQAKQDITAFGDLSSELKSLTGDFLGLGDAQSKAFTVGARAGYTLQVSGGSGGYNIREVPTPQTALTLELDAAKAAADQQSNPKSATDAASLDRQALAEAQAALKVLTQEFQNGNALVTSQQVSSAQQAVESAQKALAALQTGGSTPSTGAVAGDGSTVNLLTLQASLNTANQLLTQAQFNYQSGSGTLQDLQTAQALAKMAQEAYDAAAAGKVASSPAASTGSPTGAVTSSGAYLDVYVHQQAGETLQVVVTNSLGSNGGGGAASVSGSATDASLSAASQVAQQLSSAAGGMALSASTILQITGSLENLAADVKAVADLVGSQLITKGLSSGKTVNLNGPTGSGTTATSGTGTSGYSNSGGTSVQANPGAGGGFLPTADSAAAKAAADAAALAWANMTQAQRDAILYGTTPPSAPSSPIAPIPGGGGSTTISVDMSGSNFSGSDPAAVQTAVANGVRDGLNMATRDLRTAGSRF